MIAKILIFLAGMFVGIIISVVLLCKKNLEAYTQIQQNVQANFDAAKAVYKEEADAIDREGEENESEEMDS